MDNSGEEMNNADGIIISTPLNLSTEKCDAEETNHQATPHHANSSNVERDNHRGAVSVIHHNSCICVSPTPSSLPASP